MITVYSWYTPNPKKVVLLLEELGVLYEEVMVDPMSPSMRDAPVITASPNAKIPAILDSEGPGGNPHTVFESGAILIYLAEKYGSALLPKTEPSRSTTLQWLIWQMAGIGPMIGQFFHFSAMAPEKLPYAITRYETEMHRLLGVLNTQLSSNAYVAGPDYTVADIAIYPWVSVLEPMLKVDLSRYPAVTTWLAKIAARPAAQRTWPPVKDTKAAE